MTATSLPPASEASTTIARRHLTTERSDLPPPRTICCSWLPSTSVRRRTRSGLFIHPMKTDHRSSVVDATHRGGH